MAVKQQPPGKNYFVNEGDVGSYRAERVPLADKVLRSQTDPNCSRFFPTVSKP